MTFASPAVLWGLCLVPLSVAAYLVIQRRRRRHAVRFTNLELLTSIATALPRWRRHVPPAVFLLALAALLVAIARPQIERRVAREEAGVVLVLDRSTSMRATDVQPTRLQAAKDAAERFVLDLPDEFTVGLVSFATQDEVLSPMTSERDAVINGLRSMQAAGGTAMGDGLMRAIELATVPPDDGQQPTPSPPGDPSEDAPPVAIALLSDGFSTVGDTPPMAAAGEAGRLGIPVHTIALGTDQGDVPVGDPAAGLRVPVPPDRATLQAIAEATDGRYFDAPSGADLGQVYEALGSRIGYTTEPQEVTAGAAAAGLVLMLVGGGLSLAWFGRLP